MGNPLAMVWQLKIGTIICGNLNSVLFANFLYNFLKSIHSVDESGGRLSTSKISRAKLGHLNYKKQKAKNTVKLLANTKL